MMRVLRKNNNTMIVAVGFIVSVVAGAVTASFGGAPLLERTQQRQPLPSGTLLKTDANHAILPTAIIRHLLFQQQQIQQHPSTTPRVLEIGDFDVLNRLYATYELQLPDPTEPITEEILGSTLTVTISDLVCSDINVGDIDVDWTPDATPQNQQANINAVVSIVDIDIACTMKYDYAYSFLSGTGDATLLTEDNDITIQLLLDIDHSDPSKEPTVIADVTNCAAQVNVITLDLGGDDAGGGLMSAAVGAMQSMINEKIETEMQTQLCDQFTAMDEQVETSLQEMMTNLFRTVTPDANDGSNNNDPKAAEEAFLKTVPSDAQLMNFQNPTGRIETIIVETLLDRVSEYVSPSSINSMIRSSGMLNPEDGSLEIDPAQLGLFTKPSTPESGVVEGDTAGAIEFEHLLGSFEVEVTSAKLYGLDTFTKIANPIHADVGPHTLSTDFNLANLTMQIGIQYTVAAQNEGDGTANANNEFTDEFVLEWTLSDIDGTISILMGIDMNVIEALPLGAFLLAASDPTSITGCLSAAILELSVTELDIKSLTVGTPTITFTNPETTSPGIERLLTDGISNMFTAIEPMLQDILPDMMESMAGQVIDSTVQDIQQQYIPETSTGDNAAVCAAPTLGGANGTTSLTTPYVDFRDLLLDGATAKEYGGTGLEPYGTTALMLKDWIDNMMLQIDPVTGYSGLSSEIARMTKEQSGIPGYLSFGRLINTRFRVDIGGLQANVTVITKNVTVSNLDSLGSPMFLLDPVRQEPFLLNNSATFGLPPEPIRLAMTLYFEIALEEGDIRNEIELGVDIHSASMFLTVFMQMLETSLLEFPVGDVFNMYCWLATIPAPTLDSEGIRTADSNATLSLHDLSVSVQQMNFTVDCIECSGPKFQELDGLFERPETHESAGKSFENVLNYVLSLAAGNDTILQLEIDRMLVDAPKMCPHRPEYDPNFVRTEYTIQQEEPVSDDGKFLLALIVAMVCCGVGVLIITLIVRFFVVRRHRRWLKTLPRDRLWAMYHIQEQQRAIEHAMNTESQSMFTSKRLPLYFRWLIPFILVANIGLFLSGHLNLGGEVRIYFQLGGELIVVDDFYTFSIAQSGVELWNAGARELAGLMLLFSGVWPYTKQLITLFLWFIPPRYVSLAKRGSILLWLDFLAKWSMIDVFVMFITLAAFHVTVNSPDQPFLPDDLYQIDLLVVPMWGLYANALAQVLSQISSHIIIHYHRVLVEEAARNAANKDLQIVSKTTTCDLECPTSDCGRSEDPETEIMVVSEPEPDASRDEVKVEQKQSVHSDGPAPSDEYDAEEKKSDHSDGPAPTSSEYKPDSDDSAHSEELLLPNGTAIHQPDAPQCREPAQLAPLDKNEQHAPADETDLQENVADPVEVSIQKDGARDGVERLYEHAFARPHRGESEKLVPRRFVNPGMLVLALITIILVMIGCIMPSFSYDYRGLVGLAAESGNNFEAAYDEHSVISVAQTMMDEARFLQVPKYSLGLFSLAVLLVVTTLLVPIALVLVLVAEWFLPLPRVLSRKLRTTAEILQAWQYMEVFLLALIVGAWQIGDVSEYLVNDYCGGRLAETFSTLTRLKIIKPEDAQCFRVQAAIRSASYVMIVAAVFLHLLNSFVTKAVYQRIHDEDEQVARIYYEDREPITACSTPVSNLEEGDDDNEQDSYPPNNKITPPPVLFTDQFRWLLTGQQ